jgi:hypothetical protein
MAGTDQGSSQSRRATSSVAGPEPLHNHIDDYSQAREHCYDEHQKQVVEDDSSDDTEFFEKKDVNDGADPPENTSQEIVTEVQDGMEDQRDIEAGLNSEKPRSTRSNRSAIDPNLVTWNGPDDPENPKNWTFKHKWAATLIGMWYAYPIC